MADVEPRLWLGDDVPGLEHVDQRLLGAVLQHDVDVVRVLKVLDEPHHVFVDQVPGKEQILEKKYRLF